MVIEVKYKEEMIQRANPYSTDQQIEWDSSQNTRQKPFSSVAKKRGRKSPDLGVWINNKFRLKEHIQGVCNMASRVMNDTNPHWSALQVISALCTVSYKVANVSDTRIWDRTGVGHIGWFPIFRYRVGRKHWDIDFTSPSSL